MSYDVDIKMKVVGTDQVCQGSYDLKNPCFHNLSPPPVKLSGMAENIFIIWYIQFFFSQNLIQQRHSTPPKTVPQQAQPNIYLVNKLLLLVFLILLLSKI